MQTKAFTLEELASLPSMLCLSSRFYRCLVRFSGLLPQQIPALAWCSRSFSWEFCCGHAAR